jgi:hypothetical protein
MYKEFLIKSLMHVFYKKNMNENHLWTALLMFLIDKI